MLPCGAMLMSAQLWQELLVSSSASPINPCTPLQVSSHPLSLLVPSAAQGQLLGAVALWAEGALPHKAPPGS